MSDKYFLKNAPVYYKSPSRLNCCRTIKFIVEIKYDRYSSTDLQAHIISHFANLQINHDMHDYYWALDKSLFSTKHDIFLFLYEKYVIGTLTLEVPQRKASYEYP